MSNRFNASSIISTVTLKVSDSPEWDDVLHFFGFDIMYPFGLRLSLFTLQFCNPFPFFLPWTLDFPMCGGGDYLRCLRFCCRTFWFWFPPFFLGNFRRWDRFQWCFDAASGDQIIFINTCWWRFCCVPSRRGHCIFVSILILCCYYYCFVFKLFLIILCLTINISLLFVIPIYSYVGRFCLPPFLISIFFLLCPPPPCAGE